jgi:hypothetical protein
VLGWVLLLAALAIGCAGNGQAGVEAGGNGEGGQAKLEIRGSSGAEFSGSCAIGDEGLQEISGQVPESFTYDLKGKPLECEIGSESDLQVELTVGNDRSVQRISGGTLNLTYENGSASFVVSSSGADGADGQDGSSGSSQVTFSGGSGNVTSESRDVSGFDEVELEGIGNLSIQQSGSESLTVEAEEDVLPKIGTEVVDDRLVIGPEPGTSIRTTEPINYELTVEGMRALEVSGAGDVEAEGINTDELAVTISGSGDVKISGEADRQEIDISGSGDYRARDLESEEVKIDVGGSGSAVVNVSDTLEAKVGGSGSVEYVGDPTVEQDVSGAGEVSKH